MFNTPSTFKWLNKCIIISLNPIILCLFMVIICILVCRCVIALYDGKQYSFKYFMILSTWSKPHNNNKFDIISINNGNS